MRRVFGETTSTPKGLGGWGNRGTEQVGGLAADVFGVIPTAGNSTWASSLLPEPGVSELLAGCWVCVTLWKGIATGPQKYIVLLAGV